LVRFDPTEFRAAQDLALKRVAVLAADQLRTEQKGFLDDRARAEIGIARARLAEGEAELAFATDRLARIAVDAPADGVVLIENPHAWIGRPVRIGERIMAIADPNRVRLEAHVAVEDALVVVPGAAVSLFLASEPSRPVPAKITRMSYDARLLPNQTLAFIAEANFEAGMPAPRLGLTGTAKIYGEYRPLYYVLLRKPLAALRRLTGF
jgi:multidrug resistance efflux pump